MNSRQIFSFSLIVLSIVMGLSWFKQRPKVDKKPVPQKISVSLDEIEDEFEPDEEEQESPAPEPPKPVSHEEAKVVASPETTEEKEPVAETTPQHDDPVITSLTSLKHNPFELSPYAKLIDQIKQKAEDAQKVINTPKAVKKTTRLTSIYSASILIDTQLVAIIDSKSYREGELFNDMKISQISPQLITLNKNEETFLIPKRGVDLTISEDGTYSINDTYLDK